MSELISFSKDSPMGPIREYHSLIVIYWEELSLTNGLSSSQRLSSSSQPKSKSSKPSIRAP